MAKPRKLLRRAATGFYRIDHVYEVLPEFAQEVEGPLSVLEFGTAQGYASAKILSAIRHLGLEDRITFHGFDSFEGLPEAANPEDRGLRGNDWIKGSYRASLARIEAYCAEKGYRNARFHAGYFEETLTPELIEELRAAPPCWCGWIATSTAPPGSSWSGWRRSCRRAASSISTTSTSTIARASPARRG